MPLPASPRARRRRRRARRQLTAALALIAVVAAAVAVWARGGGGPGDVAVFPSPGTTVASPKTQIAFRGATRKQLAPVTVTGSRTGRHAGRLMADSDGQGASFLPDRPFAPGEHVTVAAGGASLLGAKNGTVRFTVGAMPAPHRDPVAEANPARENVQHLVTRPDLAPPAIDVTRRRNPAPGDIFVGPKIGDSQWGPMILDSRGRTIWFHPLPRNMQPYDFRAQTYDGRPVLTWWQGRFAAGHGDGEDVIVDRSYHRIATVHAGGGYQTDLHEFQLLPGGRALVTAYVAQPRDLRPYGGVKDGRVLDGVVQEIDVRTGLVLFEWHSLDHVPMSQSYLAAPHDGSPWDYFHLNSASLMANGDLLVSSRHAQQLYEVDPRTGAVVWRMGGQHSSFRIARGAEFAWQHDARSHPDGTITLFDNATGAKQPGAPTSRVLQLRIDGRDVEAVHSWRHRPPLIASTQGDGQILPDGHVFVGWGNAGYMSEYTPDGGWLFDAHFASPQVESYRAFKLPWHATPGGRPRLVAYGTTAWVSWNGATDVASWRLLGGASADALHPLSTTAWDGLETQLRVPAGSAYVAAQAVTADGKVLGTSPVTPVTAG